jgi:hypothetical protein
MVKQTGDRAADGVSCVPMESMFPEHADVDPACVERMMTPGLIDFGSYGLGGICKDAVESILNSCDPDTTGQAIPETPLQSIERSASEMLFGPPSLEDAMPPPSLEDAAPPSLEDAMPPLVPVQAPTAR